MKNKIPTFDEFINKGDIFTESKNLEFSDYSVIDTFLFRDLDEVLDDYVDPKLGTEKGVKYIGDDGKTIYKSESDWTKGFNINTVINILKRENDPVLYLIARKNMKKLK